MMLCCSCAVESNSEDVSRTDILPPCFPVLARPEV